MALLSALGVRSDPVLTHNFYITLIDTSSSLALAASVAMAAISDAAMGGFTECTGLEMSLKVEEYREGGRNGEVLVFPTRVEWGKLTLKKGMGRSDLWNWHYGFVDGTGRRRDGVIALLNNFMLPVNIWYFRRGLPVRYSGAAMNASQNQVAIESIEIQHEGVFQVPFAGLATGLATAGINAAVTGL